MPRKDSHDDLLCSFCGKSQDEVKKLIAGPSVYICDECIQLCNEIIAEEYGQEDEKELAGKVPKPYEIKEILDQYVIDQERPKKILSVAVHNHYKRINSKVDMEGVEIQNVQCEQCHGMGTFHGTRGMVTKVPEATCVECHHEVKGLFQLNSHHPVLIERERRIDCSDCHDPHSGNNRLRLKGTALYRFETLL